MWWAGSKAHDVYLGTRATAVCLGAESVWQEAVPDVDTALAALGAWLEQAAARCKLRVWLSGALCRPFILPAVPGIRGELEWQRMASALAAEHTGLTGPCRVWVDPTKGDVPRVAAAIEESTLDRLLSAVNGTAGHRHSLVSIRPWWADVLRAALRDDATRHAVAAQDCDSLTLLVGDRQQGDAFAVATTLTPVVDADTAKSALSRLLLSFDVPEGQEIVGRLALQRDAREPTRRDVALSPLVEFSA